MVAPAAPVPESPTAEATTLSPTLMTALPSLKPGYATSEGWISFVVGTISLLPTTLLANTSPMTLQVAGLIIAGIVAIVHGTNRTALKKAQLAASK